MRSFAPALIRLERPARRGRVKLEEKPSQRKVWRAHSRHLGVFWRHFETGKDDTFLRE
jgi:hypothetical protein